MVIALGGWEWEQSSLVAHMAVSFLLVHKRANARSLGRGGTGPPSV